MVFGGLICVLVGCGSSTITTPTSDGPIGGGQGDGPGSGCTAATQCTGDQVCNPSTGQCVSSLGCTTHTECGKGAYCTDSHVCAKNTFGGPCDTNDNCIGNETCAPGGHCGCGGEQLLGAEVVAPNMLIALDRSDSMASNKIDGVTRYDIAKNAIGTLTTNYKDKIRFGIIVWPGTTLQCMAGDETLCRGYMEGVAIGPDTGGDIVDFLTGAHTCQIHTPIAGTLTAMQTYPGFNDATRANYVVLLTDGEENCLNDDGVSGDGPSAATALRSHVPEVKTFAIGFSQEAAANGGAATLTSIATNGGTARAGTTKYYQADNAGDLATVFDNIASAIVSCDYTLSTNPDPNLLNVYVGDTRVSRDTNRVNGWDYNSTSQHLTFYGAACTLVKGGGGELSVVFGCPLIP